MISKNTEKLLRKLQSKKYRWNYQKFIAEGPKVVGELIEEGMQPDLLISDAKKWISIGAELVDSNTLKLWSQLDTSNEVLGIFNFPEIRAEDNNISLILDQINDPGNLGTLIRTCDWFGVKQIYCTPGTTDVFNAKCIQSTMGSIARVKVDYLSDEDIFDIIEDQKIMVADMDGENIFEMDKNESSIVLVMGSESHGPSKFWKDHAQAVTIPKKSNSKIESLNVAQAAGIILSHIRN